MSDKSYNLGCMKQITDLRTIWPHEALDFTPWLANNLGLLSDAIGGVELKMKDTESPVGDFRLDILAETGDSKNPLSVVIENQLTRSDHDHLGKLATYTSDQNASIVIWLVKNARKEHRKTIEWLNRKIKSQTLFFMIEVELWQIDNSKPAVKFNVVASPDDWPNCSLPNAGLSEIRLQQRQFWEDFTNSLEEEVEKRLSIPDAQARNYLTFNVGRSDFSIACTVDTRSRDKTIGVEFAVRNSEFLKWLKEHKPDLETAFGSMPTFSSGKKGTLHRIYVRRHGTISLEDPERNSYFKWLADKLIVFLDVGLEQHKIFLESRQQ